jgi:peptidoglycan/LPS O-acetylase OafA/YrhL
MIKSFEGLRGVAAFLVVLFHYSEFIDDRFNVGVIKTGYLFVDLFFVLSGYVIAYTYATRIANAQDYGAFVVRRLGRLLPLFLFSTLAYVVARNVAPLAQTLLSMIGSPGPGANLPAQEFAIATPVEILSTLTLSQSLGFFDKLILNRPSWSISTEFYTNLLFGLVCLAVVTANRTRFYAWLSAVTLVACVFASVYAHQCLDSGKCMDLTYDYGILRCIGGFVLGALGYELVSKGWLPNGLRSSLSQALLFSVAIGLVSMSGVAYALALAVPLAFALLVVSVSADTGPVAKVFSWVPFQLLGRYSYSVYLLHYPLLLLFEPVGRRLNLLTNNPLPSLLVFSFALVFISTITYRFIEDPFRKRANSLARTLFAKRTAVVVS